MRVVYAPLVCVSLGVLDMGIGTIMLHVLCT